MTGELFLKGKVFAVESFAVRLDGRARECVPVSRHPRHDAGTEVFLLVGTGRKKILSPFTVAPANLGEP